MTLFKGLHIHYVVKGKHKQGVIQRIEGDRVTVHPDDKWAQVEKISRKDIEG